MSRNQKISKAHCEKPVLGIESEITLLRERLEKMDRLALENRVEDLRQKYHNVWKNTRIALVEDVPLVSDYIVDLFDLIGINGENSRFRRFENGETLLDNLHDENYDVFLLDAELKGKLSGPDLVPQIKSLNPEAIVIGRTGSQTQLAEFKKTDVDRAIFKDPKEDPLSMFEKILSTKLPKS